MDKSPLQPGSDRKFTIEGGDVTIKAHDGSAPIVVNGNATITINNVKLNTTDNIMTINKRILPNHLTRSKPEVWIVTIVLKSSA
ncbi:hypothetical protein [Butyricimonas virosa]|uniref:Uncharacterized protein n=1 Tax=Butyricimonas virosa TaxID=544645 RepID=A0A415QQ20_9BACT|nr:hypothetical protein [Butyricimonas virosa]RHM46797.1 hypothetical protein DWZ68_02170 [Butyricimonas virosa]